MAGWIFTNLVMVGSIIALTGLRQFFIDPLGDTTSNAIWFFLQILPLLLPLPGMLSAKLRSSFVMCLVSMLYFVHGVMYAFDPHLQLLSILEIIFALGLCAATTMLVRRIRAEEADAAP
ncbi:MAG: DUF2069 domain-containing protein [Pseudomonadota bacterium]